MTVSNHFKVLMLATTMVAAVLVLAAEPAKAVFTGTNGKIAFDSFPRGRRIRRSSR